jgi:hypothetical protein
MITKRQQDIKKVCQLFYKLWKAHPTLRMGQIITIFAADSKKEIYDVKDKEFVSEIHKELLK